MTLIAIGYSYDIMILYKQQKEIMKHSILATAIALVALSSTAQAAYIYKLPLEVAGGGSLPNGTISFGNGGGATTPVEPAEPEVIDPFEPENPNCTNYPTNKEETDLGRDRYNTQIHQELVNGENGPVYRACKLKDSGEAKLLAKFVDGISNIYYRPVNQGGLLSNDRCNKEFIMSLSSAMGCPVSSNYFNYTYKYSKDSQGNVTLLGFNYVHTSELSIGFPLQSIGRLVIDGQECTNLRVHTERNGTFVMPNTIDCDMNMPYETIKAKIGKPYIVEVYGK